MVGARYKNTVFSLAGVSVSEFHHRGRQSFPAARGKNQDSWRAGLGVVLESTRCVVSWLLPAGVLTHRPSGARRLVAGPPVIAVQWFQPYYCGRGPVVSAVLPWTMTDSALPPRSWLSARPTCNCLVGLYLFSWAHLSLFSQKSHAGICVTSHFFANNLINNYYSFVIQISSPFSYFASSLLQCAFVSLLVMFRLFFRLFVISLSFVWVLLFGLDVRNRIGGLVWEPNLIDLHFQLLFAKSYICHFRTGDYQNGECIWRCWFRSRFLK